MKKLRIFIAGLHAGQAGQALIMVMVLLVLGSLVLVPALGLSATALRTGRAYESKTSELYTADAGIEDGIWRIKYDFLGTGYDEYDFGTVWEYETDTINGLTANLTIENIWIPSNVTLAGLGLSAADAAAIIESERLVVTGSAGAIPGQPYDIKIDYTPAASENLTVKSIGVWLPQGFTYTSGSGTPESADPFEDYYAVPTVSGSGGGTSIVWSYSYPYPLFTGFPGVDPAASTMTAEISFSYSPPSGEPNTMPAAIAWITTELADGSASDYPVSWDMDTRIFKLTSTVGDTTIEAYSSKAELRQMGDAMSGEYVAIGNSLMLDNYWPYDQRDTLIAESSTEVTNIPADADVVEAHLYWTGWRSDSNIIEIFNDPATSLDTNWSYASPTDWSVDSNAFKGHNGGVPAAGRLLTLTTGQDLSSYVPGSVVITWEQSTPYVFYDTCNDLDEWDNGSSWSESSNRLRGRNNSGGAAGIITMDTGQDLSYSANGTITVSWDMWEDDNSLDSDEGLDFAFSSDNGSSWSDNIQAFRDDISGTQNFSYTINSTYWTNGFMLRFELVGFTGSKSCFIDNVKITPDYTSSDGLDIALSNNGGGSWSNDIEIFRGDQGSSGDDYEYYLPSAYSSDEVKIRFKVVGMGGPGQHVSLDDIKILDLPPDNDAIFKIDGEQVHFDANGDPISGTDPVTATETSVMLNTWGYSYASHRDVSKLVETFPENPGEEHHTGNADYTVGDVDASTYSYLAHAGWSLIIIYASPSTAGHYLYLRDFFAFNPGNTNLDFDSDGEPGGDVTDFVIPEPIRDSQGAIIETTAARLTCFIGEGDSNYSGDSFQITGQQSGSSLYLANSASPWNNTWNGASPDMSYPGIDVDTFEVLWADGILQPGDTSLHLDMDSGTDAWNFIYLILSVRSETLTSGTTHYAINRN